MDYSFGAISRGSALATVEHKAGTYLLASVHGELATIAIESIKSSFSRVTSTDVAAASELCGAAPPMIAMSVAVALIDGARAYIASVRGGSVHRQRGGSIEPVSGELELVPGDDLVVAGGPVTLAGPLFSAAASRGGATPGFANDTLDRELALVLERAVPTRAFAVSAVRMF